MEKMKLIVVANLYKLARLDGNKFAKEHKTLVRENAKVHIDWVNQVNNNWQDTGRWYEVNQELTDKYYGEDKPNRDELLKEATEMGLDFAKNIKTDKLIELINENK